MNTYNSSNRLLINFVFLSLIWNINGECGFNIGAVCKTKKDCCDDGDNPSLNPFGCNQGGICCINNNKLGCFMDDDCCNIAFQCIMGRCSNENSQIAKGDETEQSDPTLSQPERGSQSQSELKSKSKSELKSKSGSGEDIEFVDETLESVESVESGYFDVGSVIYSESSSDYNNKIIYTLSPSLIMLISIVLFFITVNTVICTLKRYNISLFSSSTIKTTNVDYSSSSAKIDVIDIIDDTDDIDQDDQTDEEE
eukprot:515723_1